MIRYPRTPPRTYFRTLLVGAGLALLSGCAGQVIISQDFPEPVVVPLPYRVGIFMSDEFRNYIYSEEDADVEFEMGSNQTNLFNKVFNAMFLQAVPVDSATEPPADLSLDLVVEPVLTEYAFLSPVETATDFYAVSLKYQIRLYSPDGEIVGFWPFVAYGKSRTQMLARNESLGEATTIALRDAAAAMVSQFRGVVAKEEWKTASTGP